MDSVVLVSTLKCANGYQIGVATLNQPQVLNSFSLRMAEQLQTQMSAWEADPQIVAVILQAAGDKAFCAGGDLHSLYKSMLENHSGGAWNNRYARDFFETEYRLDYHIHRFSKPVICWGHGIVMGGGIGLMSGASHRVVSEKSRMAMPEISIGLFPDVGGSWTLNRLPGNVGKFLAATGTSILTQDALFTGFANYYVDHADWTNVVQGLSEQSFAPADQRFVNDDLIDAVLRQYKGKLTTEPGAVASHFNFITELCHLRDPQHVYQAIAELQDHADPFLSKAALNMQAGAPVSFALAMDLLEKTRHDSLADVFRLEFNIALYCCAYGQFQEGIRALLIDKDKKPNWRPAQLSEVSATLLQDFYRLPMPAGEAHPLSDLV